MIEAAKAYLRLAWQQHQHGLNGNGDERPNQHADDAPNGADPSAKGARFHDVAPGFACHKGLKAQRLDPHLATRLQRFFRIPGHSFHVIGVARGSWRCNDALATIA